MAKFGVNRKFKMLLKILLFITILYLSLILFFHFFSNKAYSKKDIEVYDTKIKENFRVAKMLLLEYHKSFGFFPDSLYKLNTISTVASINFIDYYKRIQVFSKRKMDLAYENHKDSCLLISVGPDDKLKTNDDIIEVVRAK